MKPTVTPTAAVTASALSVHILMSVSEETRISQTLGTKAGGPGVPSVSTSACYTTYEYHNSISQQLM